LLHDVADELAVPNSDKRQRREDVARVDQGVDEADLNRGPRRIVPRAEGFRVNPPHGLTVARLVASKEHLTS
jgi:hypothetical protein